MARRSERGGAFKLRGVFLTSYVILWLLMGVTLILIILLYRQFGLMLMPGRQRVSLAGLDIGAAAPPLGVEFVNGNRPPAIDWRPYRGEPTPAAWVVIFAQPGCPICEGLLDEAQLKTIPGSWPEVQFMWLDSRALPPDVRPDGWSLAVDSDGTAAQAMEVPGFPFFYLVNADGRVASKGVVNNAREIEALVRTGLGGHARDMGLAPAPASRGGA